MNQLLTFITTGEGKGYRLLLLPTAVQFAILVAHFDFLCAPWINRPGDYLGCFAGTIACSFVYAVGENGFALLFYGTLVEKLAMLCKILAGNSWSARTISLNSYGYYRLAACAISPVIWLDCIFRLLRLQEWGFCGPWVIGLSLWVTIPLTSLVMAVLLHSLWTAANNSSETSSTTT